MRDGRCLAPFIKEEKKKHPTPTPIQIDFDDGRPVYRNKETREQYQASSEFSWYKSEVHDADSYFCYVNGQNRTMEVGEQAYYCYGYRSNKFFLIHYGFCYPNNRYNSYSVHLKMNVGLDRLMIPHMVALKKTTYTQEVRFKTDQLNTTTMCYLRRIYQKSFFKGNKQLAGFPMTVAQNLNFEKHIISTYT